MRGPLFSRPDSLSFFLAALSLTLMAVALPAVVTSSHHERWLDELYTVYLLKAPSLPSLWEAIILGIDGNPPLFLSLAWVADHWLLPDGSLPTALLAGNIVMVLAVLCLLYRVALRLVSRQVAFLAVLLLVWGNDALKFLMLEMRTYALYGLLSGAALYLLVTYLQKPARSRALALSLVLALMVLAHTYAIAYVGALLGSAVLTCWRQQQTALLKSLSMIALLPMLVFMAWTPALLAQTEVARPYGWIPEPDIGDLFATLFPPDAVSLGLAALVLLAAGLRWRQLAVAEDFSTQSADKQMGPGLIAPTLVAVAASFLAFTVLIWLVSVYWFPAFVPRYFTPNLIVRFLLTVAACEAFRQLVPLSSVRWRVVLIVAALPVAVSLSKPYPTENRIACFDDRQHRFIEDGIAPSGLPVVVESPHAWFPRDFYRGHERQYIFPLDWQVVERYPFAPRNNATDFHIMQRFGRWQPQSNIMSTQALLQRYPTFLVVAEYDRSWFRNLRASHVVDARLLAESARCTVWQVRAGSRAH